MTQITRDRFKHCRSVCFCFFSTKKMTKRWRHHRFRFQAYESYTLPWAYCVHLLIGSLPSSNSSSIRFSIEFDYAKGIVTFVPFLDSGEQMKQIDKTDILRVFSLFFPNNHSLFLKYNRNTISSSYPRFRAVLHSK